MSLYEILGVAAEATQSEITKAYRKLAQKFHPDRPEGDTQKFQAITRAYEILSDVDRRARYDETGDENEGPSIKERAINFLMELFEEMLNGDLYGNLIDRCKEHISCKQVSLVSLETRTRIDITKLEKALGRVSCTGTNIFELVASKKLAHLKAQIVDIEQTQKLLKEMCTRLEEHTDNAPQIMQMDHHFLKGNLFNPRNFGFTFPGT